VVVTIDLNEHEIRLFMKEYSKQGGNLNFIFSKEKTKIYWWNETPSIIKLDTRNSSDGASMASGSLPHLLRVQNTLRTTAARPSLVLVVD